ncbi:MAG: DUF2793 domain-containing protein [Hyphomonadaceae bacterium]
MDASPNLNLPYLLPNQAQKHVTLNEALRALDALSQIGIVSRAQAVPPASPTEGVSYLIASGASGVWLGESGQLAAYQDDVWAFHTPKSGWLVWVEDEQKLIIYDGTNWQETGSGGGGTSVNPAPLIGVNATADTTNRLSVKSPASLFDHEGDDHQLKVNKATNLDTASLLFQTAYSGRAELGLAGDDDFQIKVSADGTQFQAAIRVNRMTGSVSFPQGTDPAQLVSGVTSSGGSTEVYGPPNLQTVSYERGNVTLAQNRMHFCPFHVDRPTWLTGGMIAQYNASSTSGAVLRAGVYTLGDASGDNWNIGSLISDYGTAPADVAGHKDFSLSSPILLSPGWYASAVGCDGTGGSIRFLKWMTPGLLQYVASGSGTTADLKIAGAGLYLYKNGSAAEITGGLPQSWTNNPVTDAQSTNNFTYQMLVPKWQRW